MLASDIKCEHEVIWLMWMSHITPKEAGFDGGFSEDALWIMKIGETRAFISD